MATTSSLLGKSVNNDRFNAEAAGWDKNPFVHQATTGAYYALQKSIPELTDPTISRGLDVLEIGCGTGILSLKVAPHVREVVAVDAAEGMINVLKSKIEKSDAPKNVIPVAVLLEDPEDRNLPPAKEKDADGPRRKFDLITSHLVLHHIPDLKPVLTTMFGCLKSGGEVALTDFEDFGPEAKRFHPKSKLEGVERHGIDRTWIENLMKEVGFKHVNATVGFALDKEVEKFEGEFGDSAVPGEDQGEIMKFPFLVCKGKKP